MDPISNNLAIPSNVALANNPSTPNNGASLANTSNVAPASAAVKTVEQSSVASDRSNNAVDDSRVSVSQSNTQVKNSEADTTTREVSPELSTAVAQMQEFADGSDLKLAFTVDEKTERSVVTLKDKDSGDVIRQIPSQELLDIAAQVQQITSENGSAVGLLVNGKY